MSIVNIAKGIKQVHPNDVALIKVGKFYQTFGKDAYIISYLLNYQLKQVESNTNTTGFPEMALLKVTKALEDHSVNYMLLDRSANYEMMDQCNFKEKNQYTNIYNQAHKIIARKNKVNAIYEYLMNSLDDELVKEQIRQIEAIIDEG